MTNVLDRLTALLAEASPPWQLVDVHTNLQKRVDIQLHCLLRNHAVDLLTVAHRAGAGFRYWSDGETEALARLEAEVE